MHQIKQDDRKKKEFLGYGNSVAWSYFDFVSLYLTIEMCSFDKVRRKEMFYNSFKLESPILNRLRQFTIKFIKIILLFIPNLHNFLITVTDTS